MIVESTSTNAGLHDGKIYCALELQSSAALLKDVLADSDQAAAAGARRRECRPHQGWRCAL